MDRHNKKQAAAVTAITNRTVSEEDAYREAVAAEARASAAQDADDDGGMVDAIVERDAWWWQWARMRQAHSPSLGNTYMVDFFARRIGMPSEAPTRP